MSVVVTAYLHDFGNKSSVRILCIQELLYGTKLFAYVTRIFLFDTIDKVLEVITIPLLAKSLHDVDPVTGFAFSVFRKLVVTAFTFTK